MHGYAPKNQYTRHPLLYSRSGAQHYCTEPHPKRAPRRWHERPSNITVLLKKAICPPVPLTQGQTEGSSRLYLGGEKKKPNFLPSIRKRMRKECSVWQIIDCLLYLPSFPRMRFHISITAGLFRWNVPSLLIYKRFRNSIQLS